MTRIEALDAEASERDQLIIRRHDREHCERDEIRAYPVHRGDSTRD